MCPATEIPHKFHGHQDKNYVSKNLNMAPNTRLTNEYVPALKAPGTIR